MSYHVDIMEALILFKGSPPRISTYTNPADCESRREMSSSTDATVNGPCTLVRRHYFGISLETSRLGGIRELQYILKHFQIKRSVPSGPATEFTLALGDE